MSEHLQSLFQALETYVVRIYMYLFYVLICHLRQVVANADNHNRIIDLLLRKGPWKRSESFHGELWYGMK